jgi:hypothetical protein
MNTERDVLSQLVDYHDHIAAPEVPLADDLQRGRRRVRRNRGMLAGGVAVAAVSVIVTVTHFMGQRSADLPQPAHQPGLVTPLVAPSSLLDIDEFGFHLESSPEVVATGNFAIAPDRQSIDVKAFGEDGATDLFVDVYYQDQSPEAPSTGTSEPVTVNGVMGTYSEESRPDSWEAHLSWEYAPRSWAAVSGRGADVAAPSDLRRKMVAAAEALRSGGKTVLIPVRVGAVPASLPSVAAAHDVSVQYFDGTWSWWLSLNDEIHLWATSDAGADCQGSDGSPYEQDFTYRGRSGCLVDGERIGLRLDGANVFIDFVDADRSAAPSTQEMKQILADLTVASNDPATWFDLRTGLGG